MLYNYKPRGAGELRLYVGDTIKNVTRLNKGWCKVSQFVVIIIFNNDGLLYRESWTGRVGFILKLMLKCLNQQILIWKTVIQMAKIDLINVDCLTCFSPITILVHVMRVICDSIVGSKCVFIFYHSSERWSKVWFCVDDHHMIGMMLQSLRLASKGIWKEEQVSECTLAWQVYSPLTSSNSPYFSNFSFTSSLF